VNNGAEAEPNEYTMRDQKTRRPGSAATVLEVSRQEVERIFVKSDVIKRSFG
jgi:hypothetical protein